MLYMTTPSTEPVRAVMRTGLLGAMLEPGGQKAPAILDGISYAIDNGCFADNWSEERWLRLLRLYAPHAEQARFAVVPDVVADAAATRERWDEWSPVVRGLGYRCAYVAQDGLDPAVVPWDEIDTWFTGGSTDWKLSTEAYEAAEMARVRGIPTHMGRVNSLRRLRAARDAGYSSADGTFIKFGPDINLARILRWTSALHHAPSLPLLDAETA